MTKILFKKNWIELHADYNDKAFSNLLFNTVGVYSTSSRKVYRCSYRLLDDVLYYLRGVTDIEQLPDNVAAIVRKEKARRLATDTIKQQGTTKTYPGLWGHQNMGVALAAVNKRYNFFYDTRTGKTRMAYQIMLNAFNEGRVKRCIVFTPSTIIKSWLSDAEAFPQLKVVAFYGSEKEKQHALHTPSHIVLWSTGMAVNYMDLIKRIGFDMCFFDESSKLKSYKSQTAQAIVDYSQYVEYWYNLSATPAPNGEYEYYMQMKTVDPYAFSPFITHFNRLFFDDMSNNKAYQRLRIKPEMYQIFMSIVENKSIYVDQAVMPVAKKFWHIYDFTMCAETSEAYDKMRSDLAVEAESTVITADTATAMRAKLCQLTSGFVLDTDARKENAINKKLEIDERLQTTYEIGYKDRVRALEKLLNEIGSDEQIVIWAHYEQEFIDIAKLLSFKCKSFRVLRGGTSIADKEEAIAGFKGHKVQYLVCHPLSVGMGINLTEAHHAIYYRVTDSWEALKQSSERIFGHITVQPNDCHYWVLCANLNDNRNTVDMLVYNNVSNKRDASTGFLDYLKAGVL